MIISSATITFLLLFFYSYPYLLLSLLQYIILHLSVHSPSLHLSLSKLFFLLPRILYTRKDNTLMTFIITLSFSTFTLITLSYTFFTSTVLLIHLHFSITPNTFSPSTYTMVYSPNITSLYTHLHDLHPASTCLHYHLSLHLHLQS